MPTALAQDNPAADTAAKPAVHQGEAPAKTRKVETVDFWWAMGDGLQGIKEVCLELHRQQDPRLKTPSEASLRTTIESRCKAAGLKIVQSKSDSPTLTVHLHMDFDGGQVCSIWIDLAVPIEPDKNNIPVVCNKWNSREMECNLEFEQDVTSSLVQVIDDFLKSWKARNPR